MGRPDPDQLIKHFSHPHPLKLLNLQLQSTQPPPSCSCCKGHAIGRIYHCAACNYYLHQPCSKFPREHTHAVDPKHRLTLLSSPPYPQGRFECNACGAHGSGFCYHCSECQLDLHAICAFMPDSVKHGAHEHPLTLFLSPPYETRSFTCDICRGPGSDHWLYRCASCQFDAHMKCAKSRSDKTPPTPPPQFTQQRNLDHLPHLTKSRSAPSQAYTSRPANEFPNPAQPCHHFSPPMVQNGYQMPLGVPYSIPGNGFYNGLGHGSQFGHSLTMPHLPQSQNIGGRPQKATNGLNEVLGHAVEGITGALTQQLIEAVVQGALGGN
ncbi:hypothetical protein NMG60_11003792 [Bertholletia excelsa]